MWIVGFFIFCSSPSDLYLIWVLIVHIVKGGLGLYLLNKMPKTYEIMENVAKNPDFDENTITDQINKQIKEIFITRFSEKKCYFYAYLLSNIICLVIDFVILLDCKSCSILTSSNKFSLFIFDLILKIFLLLLAKNYGDG